jgi:hypothetical protein
VIASAKNHPKKSATIVDATDQTVYRAA